MPSTIYEEREIKETLTTAPSQPRFVAETFTFVFSLQSGTVVAAIVLGALTITSFFHVMYFLIVTSSFVYHIVPFVLSYLYMILLGTGLVLVYTGAYRESPKILKIGARVASIAFFYLLCLSVLSFLPDLFDIVCFSCRCPDHLWLQKSYWRTQKYFEKYHREPITLSIPRVIKRAAAKEQPRLEEEKSTPSLKWRSRGEDTTAYYPGVPPDDPEDFTLFRRRRPHHFQRNDWQLTNDTNNTTKTRKSGRRLREEEDCEDEPDTKTGRYIFSMIASVFFNLLYLAFLGYAIFGFYAFYNQLVY